MQTELYPEIDFHLNFTPYEPFTLIDEPNGKKNATRGSFHLHQGEDELKRWKKRLQFEQIGLLYLYGIGLGYYYEALKPWLAEKTSNILVILEDDLGAIDAFLTMENAAEILHHPQVHLRYLSNQNSLEESLEEITREFPCEKVAVSALESYRASPVFKKLKLLIPRKTTLWHALLSESLHSGLFCRNILQNMLRLQNSFCINRWRGEFQGVPAVICGAGPSLQAAASHLKHLENKALLFAGGSTLSALSHLGIRPHLGLAIDPNPREYDCLKGCHYSDLPLIYGGRLLPKAFELFHGPLGYIRSGTGGACESYLEEKLGVKEEEIGPDLGREALSVTTLAVATAVALGCDPIIFVGVDMAYTDQKLYAQGVKATWRLNQEETRVSEQLVRRKDRLGRPIFTLVKWIMESDTLSSYAKLHRDRRFFNASEGGLGFRKIPYQPFEKLIQEHCTQSYNLRERISKKIAATQLNISSTAIETEYKILRKSLQRSLTLVDDILENLGSPKVIALEMELHEEVAFRPLLEAIAPAFTMAFRKSYGFPHVGYDSEKEKAFENAKWTHLKSNIKTHLETLKCV